MSERNTSFEQKAHKLLDLYVLYRLNTASYVYIHKDIMITLSAGTFPSYGTVLYSI